MQNDSIKMQNDSIKCVCEYLTGKITKEDFISEYKKQVTNSFEESFSNKNHLANVVQNVLEDGGRNLQTYARENNFDAKLSIDLRTVDENICRNKLVDALVDIGYSPKEEGVSNIGRDSGFPGYKINMGRPALRALSTFMSVTWDNIGDIIEKKLGKSSASIGSRETMRNNLAECERQTFAEAKIASLRRHSSNTI